MQCAIAGIQGGSSSYYGESDIFDVSHKSILGVRKGFE